MTIEQLFTRLVDEVNRRIRNGQLTERGLARKAAISQPHVHHILNGKRGLTPAVADRILEATGITLADLLAGELPLYEAAAQPGAQPGSVLIPLLEGAISPHTPAPSALLFPQFVPFPAGLLPSVADLVVARLGRDDLLFPLFQEGDLVVIAKGLRPLAPPQEDRSTGVVELSGSWVLETPPSEWWRNQVRDAGRFALLTGRTEKRGAHIGTVILLIRALSPNPFPVFGSEEDV